MDTKSVGALGKRLIDNQEYIASVALVVMMLVVVTDVGLRGLFNIPVRGAYDAVSILLSIVVFFGASKLILRGEEIVIDLVDSLLPKPWVRTLIVVSAISTLGVLIFVVWSMISPALSTFRYGDRSLELGIPVWVIWCVCFVGIAGTVLAAVMRGFSVIKGDYDVHDPRMEHVE